MALTAPHIGSKNLSGIALAASAFAFMTGSDTIYKLLSTAHPAYQLLAVNGLFSLLPIFIRALMTGGHIATGDYAAPAASHTRFGRRDVFTSGDLCL